MSDLMKLKKQISTAFKLSGFTLRTGPCTFLAEQLLPLPEKDRESWLEKLTGHIQAQGLNLPAVEQSHLELAIKECSSSGLDETETVLSVISAFEVPRFQYSFDRKKFLPVDSKNATCKPQYFPSANFKADYIRDRYTMLYQRTARHELFAPSTLGIVNNSIGKKFSLKRVESLLSCASIKEVVVLGLLTQLTEGKFHLEDPTGVVPLDISEARFHNGLFCEGSFVLAEGKYEDGCLHVQGLGFPPSEEANSSRAYFGALNTWGGPPKNLLKLSPRLLEIERGNTDSTIIFLSDVWLDSAQVISKLSSLFLGYEDCPPTAIVLMGPFMKGPGGPKVLKSKLSVLADILAPCESLKKETQLILVPAGEDPASPNILPRQPIPKVLAADLLNRFPRTTLATNPCRIQYCTQQIAIIRADLLTKMCRNAIRFPTEGKLEDHFAHTLVCQGTLTPLISSALPTYWAHDAVMSLYPLPDLVVVGDPSNGFCVMQQGCMILNTGSFPKSRFSFKVYVPATKTVEDSQIPDDIE